MSDYEKKLPKEYFILEYKIFLNKELYSAKIITYEIFIKMQELLIKKQIEIKNRYLKI
ncbi:MAG: hypothetical protein IJY25_04150 [Bacilli bacterium]|nr:hypothetical protein [Bacilli bacterium]